MCGFFLNVHNPVGILKERDMESVFAIAARQEKHPAVRRILDNNAWKIDSWREYASWKKHAQQWVAIEWKRELGRIAAMNGFEIVEE